MPLDFTPDTNVLDSLRNSGIKWSEALAELIDNSFDAGATRVSVEYNKSSLLIEDDGVGIADLTVIGTLGGRHGHTTTTVGQYGSGMKDAATFLADEMKVVSVHAGIRRGVTIDWLRLQKSHKWTIDDDFIIEEPAPGAAQGTRLEFHRLRHKIGNAPRMWADLSFKFYPGLASGRQILQGQGTKAPLPLKRFELPPLTNTIRRTVELSGGRSFRVEAGTVVEGHPNPYPGFVVIRGHRVLTQTSAPARDFATSRFFAEVDLKGEWKAQKNKLDVSDSVKDELYAALFDCCQALLMKSQQHDDQVVMRDVESRINFALADHGPNAKAVRKTAENPTGAKVPTGTGPGHKRAARTQAGMTFREHTKGRVTGIRLRDENRGTDFPAFRGEHHQNTITICLNTAFPRIASARRDPKQLEMLAEFALAVEMFRRDQSLFAKQLDERYMDVCGSAASSASQSEEAD